MKNIRPFEDFYPEIDDSAWIDPSAVVIGDTHIGAGSTIWPNVTIRGDINKIRIGENTNIQDNCTVHTDPGKPVFIGSGVSVGHGAVVHGCTIENDCLIGIKAAVLNGAVIRKGSIVGSGAVVREGQEVGPFQLVAGVPAEPKKRLDETVVEKIRDTTRTYLTLAAEHARNLVTNGSPSAVS